MSSLGRLAAIGAVATALLVPSFLASPAFAETTVRMWTFLNPAGTSPREVALADIIQRFEAANPDIKISVEPQAWDQLTPKFLAAHGTGNAPDIIWAATDFLGNAFEAGALADLGPLFINDLSAEDVASRKDAYWDSCTVDGAVRCVFFSRNYIGVIYRKDFFAEAGIDPATLTTWPAFIDAAKALTVKDANGAVSRWGFGQQFSEDGSDTQMMTTIMLAKDKTLFQPDGKAMWSTPAGIEALALQTAMVNEHGVTPPQAISWGADDAYEQFASGRLAMVTGAYVRVSALQSMVGAENVGFMLWPGVDDVDHAPGVLAGWAVGVWSGSAVSEAAGKFLGFMASAEADRVWVETAGQLPGSSAVIAQMPEFFDKPENSFITDAVEGVAKYGWLPPVDVAIGGYRQALNRAAQDVLSAGTDPETALKAAEERFNQQNGH
jgi:multiple sugar transport system substrate-binding protein